MNIYLLLTLQQLSLFLSLLIFPSAQPYPLSAIRLLAHSQLQIGVTSGYDRENCINYKPSEDREQGSMNVDIDNFHQARRYISAQGLIAKSKYISFDLEFTGVKFDNNEKDKYDMFLNEKYQKMAAVAGRFNIVQIGLTFVLEDQSRMKEGEMDKDGSGKKEESAKYIAYPYNFYVFPRESPTSSPVISMQAGCIEFNTSNNMDWNRWIRKGLTYVRIGDFNKHLQNMSTSYLNSTSTITNSTCSQYNNVNGKLYGEILGELTEKVRAFVEDIVVKCKGKEVGFKYVVEVPKFSIGAIRRAIEAYAYQHSINLMLTKCAIAEHYEEDDQELKMRGNEPENVNLEVEVISEQRKLDEEQKRKEEILGFSLIFQEIWNSGKTLIGHNCLYDLLFIYSAFVDELPRDYQNFKRIINDKADRRFFDTKYLAAQVEIAEKVFKKGTSLEELYKYYKEKKKNEPIISLAPGYEAYDLEKPSLHEAGFDSYLTAWVFLHLPMGEGEEGKLSIFKSYFYLNLRTLGDQIRKDMSVFVVAVVLNNAYVPYEQLRTMRMAQSKLIREELQKENLMNDVIVIDGFKEIFLSMRDVARNAELIRFLIALKKNKVVNSCNVMSLESWIKMRAEVVTQMPALAQTKSKS